MKPWNIIFIVADDMAPWVCGPDRHPDAKVPTIDSLAKEGALFSNCFTASPVCSPARSCLLTGLYSTETGLTDYLCTDIHDDLGVGEATQTWVRELRDHGYQTALFGKWHLGEADCFHPTKCGYDEFKGWRSGAGISLNPEMEIDGVNVTASGYSSDLITDYAIDFIKKRADAPFLVSLHFWEPHVNQNITTSDGDRTWHPLKDDDWDLFKDIDPEVPNPDYPKLDIPRVKRMTKEYLASVHAVDRNLARILNLLKTEQIDDQTVIILTSDNGYNLGHHGIWHKGNGWWILTDNRGDRPNMYDNSLRVPTVIKCPFIKNPGIVINDPISTFDWFPTILGIAGIEPAERITVRGKNLLPVLQHSEAIERDGLFMQYRMWDWNQTGADLRACRTKKWKLIIDFKNTVPNELYDLENDPHETVNLYHSDSPEIIDSREALLIKILETMKSIDDPILKRLEICSGKFDGEYGWILQRGFPRTR
ncbi:MAG: sulfatase-like hydrolase/transferase [Kiritimatiellales bacterium]